MTRQDFVERFRHELGGMILDGVTRNLDPRPDFSVFIRSILRKVDAKLSEMYDVLQSAKQPPVTNGKPSQQQVSKT